MHTVSKETHRSTAPLQLLSKETLDKLPILQLSDALKLLPGITIKDYGGVGGMKTVAVRGLGANHTGVAYDGIVLSDEQTGQIDIGKVSLSHLSGIAVANGISDNLLTPARLHAFASQANMLSRQPDTTRFIDLTAGFKLGSFGLINPTLFLENRIFKKEKSYLYTSLLIDFIRSKGDYPYTLFYGGENDSTSREKRENSDFESLNGEFNIYAQFNKNNHLQAKFYYYQSERGLPGATILYSRHSAQRLWDQQFFGQFAFHSTYKKIDYQLLGKINYAYQHYLDPYYLNIAGKLNNHYMQREAYLSNLVRWKISRRFQAALSNDLIYGNMSADLEQFVYPERYSSLSLLSLHYDTWRFNATASLLHTCVANNTQSGESGGDVNRLSPAIGINIKPLLQEEWFARVFFKNIYRLPTFNDLYYKDVGNNNLKPEDTYQFNIGSTYDKKIKNRYQISVTTDFYYNIVKEKIVAIPTKNLFVWAMLNFGRVEIMGLDVNTQQKCSINKKITLLLMANYSFQHAVDKTDPEAKTYGHRIPYTPKHSGSATFGVENPWVNINYLLYFNGKRYALQQNIEENILRPYTDQSFTLSHKFEIKKHWIDIQLSMTNIFNVQYEIIRNFPMQGRSFGIRVLYGMN
ncbi:MAG: TonB-dependent receptor plug domain-containing protein [Bacteroidales bacterium]|nr:TonB-dependent receptor plug domain-containing protein [Bacteroidales bacterium]